MEQFTIKDLRKLSPCYDPTKYLPEDWQGTVLDILNVTECPAKDRLWVVLHKEFMTDKQLRLFAVWCARQSLAIPGNESEVCSNTCDVAERYANGEATDEELAAAWDAAKDVAWYVARSAAWYAARSAAWSAAWDAAKDAARSAAKDAARSAQINHLKIMLA